MQVRLTDIEFPSPGSWLLKFPGEAIGPGFYLWGSGFQGLDPPEVGGQISAADRIWTPKRVSKKGPKKYLRNHRKRVPLTSENIRPTFAVQ